MEVARTSTRLPFWVITYTVIALPQFAVLLLVKLLSVLPLLCHEGLEGLHKLLSLLRCVLVELLEQVGLESLAVTLLCGSGDSSLIGLLGNLMIYDGLLGLLPQFLLLVLRLGLELKPFADDLEVNVIEVA